MRSIRVVLADDHAVVRASIRRFLDYTPEFEVVGEASNGLEALRLARELTPDVLLLDMEMPQMTGIEVARWLKVAKSPVRILALSAYDDWAYIESILDIGAAGYLIKAEAPEIIVEAVRGIAQGEEGWISPQVAKQMSAWTHQTHRQALQIPLTRREKAILQLVAAGKTNQEIGQTLGLNQRLVESYLETMFAKLGVTSRAASTKRALQKGII